MALPVSPAPIKARSRHIQPEWLIESALLPTPCCVVWLFIDAVIVLEMLRAPAHQPGAQRAPSEQTPTIALARARRYGVVEGKRTGSV